MLRTGTARRAAIVASTTSLLLVSLVLSGLGAAGAIDQPAPGDAPAATETEEPAPPAPAPDQQAERPLAPRPPVSAVADATTIESYSNRYISVLANDSCDGATPCQRSALTSMTVDPPAGWGASVEASTGRLRVGVPSGTPVGYYPVHYTITDSTSSSTTYLRVRVVLPPTPDHYTPYSGPRFSHAFQRRSSNRIRSHVIRTINSVPRGGQIRVLTWSFNSGAYSDALKAAKRRGVSVQVILASGNNDYTRSYPGLFKVLGGQRYRKDTLRGSWIYRCYRSCRGRGGTMHSKVFLFSQVYNTRFVTMSGSGNFTDFAAKGQWNQLYTNSNDKAIYDATMRVFQQMKYDRPASPRQLTIQFPRTTYFYTPLAGIGPQYDFIYRALERVSCKGASTNDGRTKIRISMYVWRDQRGDWMARQVRRLWNEGCDVRIIYAIMGNRNKAILYSPGGRGRIPMRQTLQVDEEHRPVWYLHQKYIVVGGKIGTDTSDFQVYQGSFNFSDLGMRSDENMQRVEGYNNYKKFVTDFNEIWVQRETRAPNPNSYVLQEQRLGTGRYQFMEPN